MSSVRPAAVAGMFYPARGLDLRETVQALLKPARADESLGMPKALIVPHAGYVYSGAVAAHAYAQLRGVRDRIRRVVLLGPAHRVYVRGLALPTEASFATPLGEIPLDQAGMLQLSRLPQVVQSSSAHQMEHSLEVQLPFLQQMLGAFDLLPLAVGDATAHEVAEVLEAVWGGDETLIVISSDLSHFLPDTVARQIDSQTVASILAMQPHLNHEQACGATPINGFLLAARHHRLQPVVLDVRNSSETSGDPDRVVGYAAFAFLPRAESVQSDVVQGSILLKLARSAIAEQFGHTDLPVVSAPWLEAPGACFVTLMLQGYLRGCIGSLEARRPLGVDVRENAIAAAFRDSRFAPLSEAEFDQVRIEVSVLSPSENLVVASEADALAQLRPGIDGVIFECGPHRSTFLPQVWDTLPTPVEFMAQLKRKAGLAPDFWSDEVTLSRYTVRKWKEGAP